MIEEAESGGGPELRILTVTPTMVDYALAYARRGWAVFPLAPGTKVPAIPAWEGGHGHLDATCDEDVIRAWWTRWPDANIGLPVPAGHIVFDVDTKDGAHIDDLGEIPETVIGRSGSGGWHVWFTLPPDVDVRGGRPIPGVDIRAAGKNYLVVFPSLHENGKQYTWERSINHPAALIPSHLLERVRKAPPLPAKAGPTLPGSAAKWLDEALAKVAGGEGRNDTGFWMACQMRDDGFDWDKAFWPLRNYQQQVDRPDDPYTWEEARKSLEKAFASPAREPAQGREQTPALPRRRGQEEGAERPLPQGSSGETVRESGETVAPKSGGSAAPEAILNGVGDSFIPFDSIHSGKTDTAWAERFPDLLEAMQLVDALPADGPVTYPGSPAIERRRKQYNILRAAWEIHFPVDPLRQTAMSTWLNWAAKSAPGMEGEMILDAMDGFYHAPHNGPIRTPRAAFSTALENDLNPEGKADRRAKKDATRAEYRKVKKETPDTLKPDQPAAPKPMSDEARWAAVREAGKRLKFHVNTDDGNPRTLESMERLAKYLQAESDKETA